MFFTQNDSEKALFIMFYANTYRVGQLLNACVVLYFQQCVNLKLLANKK